METNNCRLEMYKSYVDSSLRLTERRQAANQFFMSLTTAIIGGGYVALSAANWGLEYRFLAIGPLAILVGYVGRMWKSSIKYYRELNSAKFEVIHRMEEDMKSCRPFKEEWDILTDFGKKKAPAVTTIEKTIPEFFERLIIFGGLYTMIGAALLTCIKFN